MPRRIQFVAAIAIGLVVMVPALSRAQQEMGIVAVVNDEAVSGYDLRQRLNLIIRSSSLPDTPEARKQLAPRVVQSLVEETLQLQEAKRLNIRVTQKEVDGAIRLLERQNHLPPNGLDAFLEERHIDKRTLMRQLEAGIAWGHVVSSQLQRHITVTDEEVKKALERIKAEANKPRILAAEIFIAADTPAQEAAAREEANRIFGELRRGASFPLTARQFSQSASANRGGDLGWVSAGELAPEVAKTVEKMPANSVSEPIRTSAGYYIVAVRDRRESAKQDVGNTVVSLRQVVLPMPKGSSWDGTASQRELARTIKETVRGCRDFAALTKELGAGASGDLGRIKLSELPGDLRSIIDGLRVGVPSDPVPGPEGFRLLMVCDRKGPKSAIPDTAAVRRRLMLQRLEVRARRYLRELRERAFVDIRA